MYLSREKLYDFHYNHILDTKLSFNDADSWFHEVVTKYVYKGVMKDPKTA